MLSFGWILLWSNGNFSFHPKTIYNSHSLSLSPSSLEQGHFAEVCTNETVVTNAFISFGYVFFKYLPMHIAIDDCMYIWILDAFHRTMIEHWIVTKNCIKLLHLMREHTDTLCYTTNTIYRYGTIEAICIMHMKNCASIHSLQFGEICWGTIPKITNFNHVHFIVQVN